jgi:hypothetical protein
MTSNSSSSEINISRAYHDKELELIWLENKTPAVYESGILHGFNCLCCSRVPKQSIIRNKSKHGRKAEVHRK